MYFENVLCGVSHSGGIIFPVQGQRPYAEGAR
jgi:hypothetical protein